MENQRLYLAIKKKWLNSGLKYIKVSLILFMFMKTSYSRDAIQLFISSV